MDYFYTDLGNHETWNTALQGGSYCRLHKLQRFFYGSEDLFAGLGSDNFRLDSQISINTANVLGELISAYDGGPPAAVRYSPVGIVEDENSEHGRYFALRYDADGGGIFTVTGLYVYDSPYLTELSAGSFVASWMPLATIPIASEQSMRVVSIAGDTPAPNRTFLYYLETTSVSTIVYYVVIPDSGVAANTLAPVKVTEIDILSQNRIYVTHIKDNLVGIYVGDSDRSQARRTTAIIHDPTNNSIQDEPFTLVVDSIPFPQSYACCRGRGDEIHMLLEPISSWRDGWGTHRHDRSDTADEAVAPQRKTSGNQWVLTTLIETGRIIEEQISFDGTDIQPWLGSTGADSMGGKFRASVVPWFICRQTEPPEKFASDFGLPIGASDISFSYIMTASVGMRQPTTPDEDAFLQRVDKVSNAFQTYGNHRSTTMLTNISDQPFAPSPVLSRSKMNLLVPGTILIEPSEVEDTGTFESLVALGTQANRLDSWRILDNNAPYGQPNADLLDAPAPPDLQNPNHNPSTDCIHGVQANAFDDTYGVVVGWFINGEI